MAIQMRRGNAANYDEAKMLPGEFGVATDEEELYIAFATGNSKRVLTEDDIPINNVKKLWTATCTTAANISAKVINLRTPDEFALDSGNAILVSFSQPNTTDAPTIKVGSNGTGKSIAYQTANGLQTMNSSHNTYSHWGIGLKLFIYTGTYWVMAYPDAVQVESAINDLAGGDTLTATDQGSGVVELSIT